MSRKFYLFAIALMCMVLIPSNLFAQTTIPTGVYTYPSYTYPKPSWWNGEICDKSHYENQTGRTPYVLASWREIDACGPRPDADNVPNVLESIPGTSHGLLEWQCVELVARYLYIAYGLFPIQANGYQVVDHYAAAYPNQVEKVANDGQLRQFPQAGDVLSYLPNHTSIVTALTITNAVEGAGVVRILEQNLSSKGYAEHQVTGWIIQPYLGNTITGWLHPKSWTDLSPVNDSGVTKHFLTGITAVNSTNVWTVGYQHDPKFSTDSPSIKHFDGISWKSYNPNGLYGIAHHLYGVAASPSGQLLLLANFKHIMEDISNILLHINGIQLHNAGMA